MASLVLGTAQWGNAYGVTNARGRLSDQEIREIIDVTHSRDVREVDTARGYGDAESRLRPYARNFAVTTKVSGAGHVSAQIQSSLQDLDVAALDAVLIHDWHALMPLQRSSAVRDLGATVDAGLVTRVGVSIYEEKEVESALEVFAAEDVPLGALQVPANPVDRRLDDSPLLGELRDAGAHITVRSAFLQGVLLADESRWSDHQSVADFRAFVSEGDTDALQVCLGHVRGLRWASHVVVGVTSAGELSEICDAWDRCTPRLLPDRLGSMDLDLIDPRRW